MIRREMAHRPRSNTSTIFVIGSLEDFQREIFNESRAHGLNLDRVHRTDFCLHLLERTQKGKKNVAWSIIASLRVNANLGCIICAWRFELVFPAWSMRYGFTPVCDYRFLLLEFLRALKERDDGFKFCRNRRETKEFGRWHSGGEQMTLELQKATSRWACAWALCCLSRIDHLTSPVVTLIGYQPIFVHEKPTTNALFPYDISNS